SSGSEAWHPWLDPARAPPKSGRHAPREVPLSGAGRWLPHVLWPFRDTRARRPSANPLPRVPSAANPWYEFASEFEGQGGRGVDPSPEFLGYVRLLPDPGPGPRRPNQCGRWQHAAEIPHESD